MVGGSVISFSLALVSSIFFDTHFQLEKSKSKDKYLKIESFGGIYYKILPWLILSITIITFMLDLLSEDKNINREYLLNTQLTAIALAYIYTAYYKYCSFLEDLK